MKKLNKEQKAKILRWEDVPLAANELKRLFTNDPSKFIQIGYGFGRASIIIKGEKLKNLKKIVANAKESINLDVDIDENYIDSMDIWADDIKDAKIKESEETYMGRIEIYKKLNFTKISYEREAAAAKNKEKSRSKEMGDDKEYRLYLKLKKKYKA